jgi:hypothetical protein
MTIGVWFPLTTVLSAKTGIGGITNTISNPTSEQEQKHSTNKPIQPLSLWRLNIKLEVLFELCVQCQWNWHVSRCQKIVHNCWFEWQPASRLSSATRQESMSLFYSFFPRARENPDPLNWAGSERIILCHPLESANRNNFEVGKTNSECEYEGTCSVFYVHVHRSLWLTTLTYNLTLNCDISSWTCFFPGCENRFCLCSVSIVTWRLKAGMVELELTFIPEQRLGNHVYAATNINKD